MATPSRERELRDALARGEFIHVYQPIVDLTDLTVNSVEALVRWQHPERGLLSPASFLGHIQDLNLSDELTRVTIRNVASDLAEIKALLGAHVNVGINLSRTQLTESTLLILDQELAAHDVASSSLVVEVVEDLASHDLSAGIRAVAGLRERGIRVVLDDFGTGAGALSLLTDLAYDGLKIDRHFVSRLRGSGPARSVVEAMLAFCRDTDVVVVAEGVEDEATLNELIELGCPYAQGYLLGMPSPVEQLSVWRPRSELTAADEPLDETELTEIRKSIDERIPLTGQADLDAVAQMAQTIEGELAQLASTSRDDLLIDLGFRKTLAMLYSGNTSMAIQWGLETSRLAERLGRAGRSASLLSLLSALAPSDASDRSATAEGMARAVTIRLNEELLPIERTTIDNNIGVTLSTLGMYNEAIEWFLAALATGTDCRGYFLAGLNLADVELNRLHDLVDGLDEIPESVSLKRIEQGLAAVETSDFRAPAVAESIRARLLIFNGELDKAEQVLVPLAETNLTSVVSVITVCTAKALLAEARGSITEFLIETTMMTRLLSGNTTLRNQRMVSDRIHARALAAAGRHDEAAAHLRTLLADETRHSAYQLHGFYDWMRIVVDVDRRYNELSALRDPSTGEPEQVAALFASPYAPVPRSPQPSPNGNGCGTSGHGTNGSSGNQQTSNGPHTNGSHTMDSVPD